MSEHTGETERLAPEPRPWFAGVTPNVQALLALALLAALALGLMIGTLSMKAAYVGQASDHSRDITIGDVGGNVTVIAPDTNVQTGLINLK